MQWYTGNSFYDSLLIVGFVYAALVFVSSLFGTAQYGGRFGGGKRSKGVKLHAKTGWVLMELPGLVIFPIVFFMGENSDQLVPLIFLAIWMIHYSNRALLHPADDARSARLQFVICTQCSYRRLVNTVFTRLF